MRTQKEGQTSVFRSLREWADVCACGFTVSHDQKQSLSSFPPF